MQRQSLASLKSAAYAAYGVTTTGQLKQLFPDFDFRQRATWDRILLGINVDNNMVRFVRPLTALFQEADSLVHIHELDTDAYISYYNQFIEMGLQPHLASRAAKSMACGYTASNSPAIRAAYLKLID